MTADFSGCGQGDISHFINNSSSFFRHVVIYHGFIPLPYFLFVIEVFGTSYSLPFFTYRHPFCGKLV